MYAVLIKSSDGYEIKKWTVFESKVKYVHINTHSTHTHTHTHARVHKYNTINTNTRTHSRTLSIPHTHKHAEWIRPSNKALLITLTVYLKNCLVLDLMAIGIFD